MLAGAMIVSTLTPPVASAQVDLSRRPFTSAERSALGSGHLVVRATEEQRGPLHLIGGASWQVVDLPATTLWHALHDTGHLPDMLPKLDEARVIARNGSMRTVQFRHHYGPIHVAYALTMHYDESHRTIVFTLDNTRPSSLRAAWGFLAIKPYGGRSLISFGIMADVGEGIISGLLRPQVHKWILRVPSTIKKFVEGRGHALYVRSL